MDGKEALEFLKEECRNIKKDKGNECAKIITQALERLEQLEKENQKLDRKLEAEFEDSADEICKIANERDKLFDENIELQIEIRDLKEKNEILNHNSTNIVLTDTEIMKRNLELQTENEKLKARCKAIPPLIIKNEKLINTIIFLNKYIGFKLLNEGKDIKGNEVYSISPIYEYSNLPKEIYDLFEEVLSDE